MTFAVLLTADAARDLEELYEYIARHDSPARAQHVLRRIEKAFADLTELPERGVIPRELAAVGMADYREVFFKPYRVVYGVSGKSVIVYLIADGRRDMRTLLQRRLLDG
jgi:toxin ParE1/3/4